MIPPPPKIGIVLLNYNSAGETLACLESLRGSPCGEMRIFVVDNGSKDDSAEVIPPSLLSGEAWLPMGANLGFSAGNNAGIREALAWGADYVLIVNPDCRVEKGYLQVMVRALEAQPWAGTACGMVLDRHTGTIQSLGGSFSLWTGRAKRRFLGRKPGDPRTGEWSTVDFSLGACLLLKRAFLEEVGLLNDAYFLYYEDTEMGLRAHRAGWTNLVLPQSRSSHADTSASRFGDPLVTFHGTRNQAWAVRQYGRVWHLASFFGICLFLRWPFRFAARLFRGKFRAAWAVVRGAWAGTFSRAWDTDSHLAVPLGSRNAPLAEVE